MASPLISRHTRYFLKQLQQRINSKKELDWCLTSDPKLPYVSDHLFLKELGLNRIQSSLNKLCSRYFPRLWKQWIWKRIYHRIIWRVSTIYLSRISKQSSVANTFKITRTGKNRLKALFHSLPVNIKDASVIEILKLTINFTTEFGKQFVQTDDLFKKEKEQQNNSCLEIYQEIQEEIWKREDALFILVYLCIRANWIDSFEDNIETFINGFKKEINELLDDTTESKTDLENFRYFQLNKIQDILTAKEKKHILYELDNCGEVIMDLLLVQWILEKDHQVTLVCKSGPILNDVDIDTIQQLVKDPRLSTLQPYLNNHRLQIIESNSNFVGKELLHVSESYKAAYLQADLLFLKGQGNFQSMPMGKRIRKSFKCYRYKKPIVYMMGVRAKVIQQCLKQLFSEKQRPKEEELFLYYFDSSDPLTYPK